MGAVADGALARGGKVRGILPRFMQDLEWGHPKLTELRIVEDLRVRKHLMLSESDGLVALPGGCGTLEELFEALTLKRLGLYRSEERRVGKEWGGRWASERSENSGHSSEISEAGDE